MWYYNVSKTRVFIVKLEVLTIEMYPIRSEAILSGTQKQHLVTLGNSKAIVLDNGAHFFSKYSLYYS